MQTDDGNQDVADLHLREDLLLDHYSWADLAHTKVRIPIERAMELMAQRGLPVAPAVQLPAPLTGDIRPVIQAPLTSGFARTDSNRNKRKLSRRRANNSKPASSSQCLPGSN